MTVMAGQPPGDYRIYDDLADWWPLISPPREYTQEAAYLAAVLRDGTMAHPAPATMTAQSARVDHVIEVLDLGSGGGHVAVHLKDQFSLTLVDISPKMLA